MEMLYAKLEKESFYADDTHLNLSEDSGQKWSRVKTCRLALILSFFQSVMQMLKSYNNGYKSYV